MDIKQEIPMDVRFADSKDFITGKVNIGKIIGYKEFKIILAGETALLNYGIELPYNPIVYVLTEESHFEEGFEYHNLEYYKNEDFTLLNSFWTQTIKNAIQFIRNNKYVNTGIDNILFSQFIRKVKTLNDDNIGLLNILKEFENEIQD